MNFATPRARKPEQEMCMDALTTPRARNTNPATGQAAASAVDFAGAHASSREKGIDMKEDKDKTWMEVHGGFAKDMTLRDHFAGLAITGISLHDVPSEEAMRVVVNDAYRLADAMLKVREGK